MLVTAYMAPSLWAEMEAWAKKNDMTASRVLRQALREDLKSREQLTHNKNPAEAGFLLLVLIKQKSKLQTHRHKDGGIVDRNPSALRCRDA